MVELTIILPVYNGWPYIETAVDSILDQTFENFLLFIINDGSTDGTTEYLKSINDKRVRIFNQENRGLGYSLNRGLKEVTTPFVARMDADDYSCKRRFEKQLDFLKSNPDIGACGTFFHYFSQSPRIFGYPPPLPQSHEDVVKALRAVENAILHPTLMMRSDVVRKSGFYRFEGIGEDWDFFLRLSEVSKIVNLPHLLYRMRLHPGSLTWKNWEDCRLKYEFAVASQDRRQNRDDLTFHDFLKEKFSSRSKRFIWRIFIFMDSRSLLLYRKGIIAGLKKKPLLLFLLISISVIVAPWKLLRRLRKHFIFKKK